MIRWSPNFAYAIGLIATDGNLSKDGRHINFTSKDLEQIKTFLKAIRVKAKIGVKSSGYSQKRYYYVGFSNVKLYRFLLNIGLTPNKSKTLGRILVPDKYFHDFLRGCLDGDGYNYSYWDPRWKSSFMLYTGFVSASRTHLEWLHKEIERLYGLKGKIKLGKRVYQLMFAKKASLKLLSKLFYSKRVICLERKYFKIEQALSIIHKQAGMLER